MEARVCFLATQASSLSLHAAGVPQMELIPSKLGFATTWSFSLHGQKAQDLVRHAAIGGYLSKQSGYLSKGWEKRFFVLVRKSAGLL